MLGDGQDHDISMFRANKPVTVKFPRLVVIFGMIGANGLRIVTTTTGKTGRSFANPETRVICQKQEKKGFKRSRETWEIRESQKAVVSMVSHRDERIAAIAAESPYPHSPQADNQTSPRGPTAK
jgi:hypothetical protein